MTKIWSTVPLCKRKDIEVRKNWHYLDVLIRIPSLSQHIQLLNRFKDMLDIHCFELFMNNRFFWDFNFTLSHHSFYRYFWLLIYPSSFLCMKQEYIKPIFDWLCKTVCILISVLLSNSSPFPLTWIIIIKLNHIS